MRKQIAAANWKMNLTLEQGKQLMNDILSSDLGLNESREAIFGVPFPYLAEINAMTAGQKNCYTAAQNCSAEKSGAFTGDVSAEMISSLNIPYVIIGHSECREYYRDTDVILAKKINMALDNKLKPIFCCGEPLDVREKEMQNAYIESQLKAGLFHLKNVQIENFVIAYEPIWAIGTGRTASSEQAQEMHAHIRKVLKDQYGPEIANSISILYGGSVKAANAKEIFAQPDVDGGLVGGASLVAAEFTAIIKSLK